MRRQRTQHNPTRIVNDKDCLAHTDNDCVGIYIVHSRETVTIESSMIEKALNHTERKIVDGKIWWNREKQRYKTNKETTPTHTFSEWSRKLAYSKSMRMYVGMSPRKKSFISLSLSLLRNWKYNKHLRAEWFHFLRHTQSHTKIKALAIWCLCVNSHHVIRCRYTKCYHLKTECYF